VRAPRSARPALDGWDSRLARKSCVPRRAEDLAIETRREDSAAAVLDGSGRPDAFGSQPSMERAFRGEPAFGRETQSRPPARDGKRDLHTPCEGLTIRSRSSVLTPAKPSTSGGDYTRPPNACKRETRTA
jgi:hypothetical protein